MSRLVEKISTLKILRRERAERAKKLVKQKKKEEAKEVVTPMVIEKPRAPVKKEEIVEQEAFEFMESKKAFQLPLSPCWRLKWRRGRRSIGTV